MALKPLLGKLHPWEPLRLCSKHTSSTKLSTVPPPAQAKLTARSSAVSRHPGVGLVPLLASLSLLHRLGAVGAATRPYVSLYPCMACTVPINADGVRSERKGDGILPESSGSCEVKDLGGLKPATKSMSTQLPGKWKTLWFQRTTQGLSHPSTGSKAFLGRTGSSTPPAQSLLPLARQRRAASALADEPRAGVTARPPAD